MSEKPTPADLGKLPLFGGLPEEALRGFAGKADHRSVGAGEVVFREGDTARTLHVLVTGGLDVVKQRGDGEVLLGKIVPGESFGEMSYIDMQPRSATVRATQDCELWEWPYSAFRERYEKDPKTYMMFVMNIARELSRRLRRTDDLLARASS